MRGAAAAARDEQPRVPVRELCADGEVWMLDGHLDDVTAKAAVLTHLVDRGEYWDYADGVLLAPDERVDFDQYLVVRRTSGRWLPGHVDVHEDAPVTVVEVLA